MKFTSRWLLACALATSALSSNDAEACGGLFCSSSNPVNQAAERIIFSQDGDTVSAVIEIQYEGPADSFAWILPVPGGEAIEVGVSSRQALDDLQQRSNPQYNLQTTFEQCPFDDDFAGDDDAAGDDGFAPEPEPEAPPDAVEVVASGVVGPYDYVQLSVDSSLPDPADVAVNWLEENEYDVSNVGADLLGSYLQGGLDLIAFRLTKGNMVGSIRPIALRWTADYPVIPIRPTAVAANDDMGILVWVLGPERAVPTNYLHLELNEAKINWFNPGATYNDVVIAAADEAGGRGFVTEQSTPAETFATIFPPAMEAQFESLRTGEFASLAAFFESAVDFATYFNSQTFQNEFYDGFVDVLGDPDVVPLREGATPEQFAACVACYFETNVAVRNDRYPSTPYEPETDPIHGMSVPAFLDRLEDDVFSPMRDTGALFREGLVATRLYTTLSADEMIEDPAFDFNPDLDPVDNVHTADRLIRCDGTQRITLPQGFVVDASNGSTWPVSVDDELPMNHRIVQLSTSGRGDVSVDNTERIQNSLTDLDIGAAVPEDDDIPADDDVPMDDDMSDDDDVMDDDVARNDPADAGSDRSDSPNEAAVNDGCGCRLVASEGSSGDLPWLLGMLVASVWRRKAGRRVRPHGSMTPRTG